MRDPKNQWHRWYAWHPVLIDDGERTYVVAFEDVMRRRVHVDGKYRWHYAFHEGSMGF